MGPMLDCPPRWAPVLPVRRGAGICCLTPARRRATPHPGRSVMPESPTPIIHPTATRSERFQRKNGVPAQPPAAPPPRKPKLKKLRLALVFGGLSILALISTVFGMLMAVASDLPSLENRAQYDRAENSVLYADTPGCKQPGHNDDKCTEIAKLTGNQNRILVGENQISPNVKNA